MLEKVEFRYLNEEDMLKAGVDDMHQCMKSIQEMFVLLHDKDYRMGGEHGNEHGIRVSFPKTTEIEGMPTHAPDRRFMTMPAYLGGRFHMFGIKSYGSNPRNNEKGLPRSILMMTLMDVETGIPLAYMSANILSAMRTGAAAGIGAKYLAKKGAQVLSIIGPGTMARYAMKAFMETQHDINKLKIKGRGEKNLQYFIQYCKKHFPQIQEYVICDTEEEACRASDIIYYGTTNALRYEDNPKVKYEWIKEGALIISVSALLAETSFLAKENVQLVADNYQMYQDWGEGQPLPTQKTVSTLLGMGFFDAVSEKKISRDQIDDIGDIICGYLPGRKDDKKIILYAVGGMPIEDVAWAYDCYKAAKEKNIGIQLKLWDKPEI